MVDENHTAQVMKYIEIGKRTASLVTGGERVAVDGKGFFVQPTFFEGLTNDHQLAREEIFGQVLVIIPFEDEEEAVGLANDTDYGLAASVWTNNFSRAHRIADRLRLGTVSVNTVDALSSLTPFGEVKQSGYGRDLSLHALEKFTVLKTIWLKYWGRDS